MEFIGVKKRNSPKSPSGSQLFINQPVLLCEHVCKRGNITYVLKAARKCPKVI